LFTAIHNPNPNPDLIDSVSSTPEISRNDSALYKCSLIIIIIIIIIN